MSPLQKYRPLKAGTSGELERKFINRLRLDLEGIIENKVLFKMAPRLSSMDESFETGVNWVGTGEIRKGDLVALASREGQHIVAPVALILRSVIPEDVPSILKRMKEGDKAAKHEEKRACIVGCCWTEFSHLNWGNLIEIEITID